ncbi:class I tRNA ligase family protein [Kutzneria sp. 744]|uniref:class I tRNA ligase family protein n=1 Tax=Kutzneria sp. (strain 744) TaxID=345341 RepID=UPI0004B461E2|nr:class I tRNA ligase family protein [Kutzneria sp. 744]
MTLRCQLSLGGRTVPLLDRARIYTCGITPYDVTHLGHAATFVWADALSRVLRALDVEPITCRNVTDVDEVLDVAAWRAGSEYDRFAAIQQFEFEGDMAALNVRPPEHEPRAHRYVDAVARLAGALLTTGDAYTRGGSVYFRGRAVVRASGLDVGRARALAGEYGGRLDDPAKEDPFDVAVWQAAEPDHPEWESPWGPGRPGWHAECVAMSLSAFGVGVDFHAGGADLAFPHHAYHRAMAEAVTGVRPYARAWLHAGTVTVDGAKMAKSAGNLVRVEDLLAAAPAAVVRMMILDRPWARDWDYTPELLEVAADRVDRLYRAAARPGGGDADETLGLLSRDLDVTAAVDLATDVGGASARRLASVLGLA